MATLDPAAPWTGSPLQLLIKGKPRAARGEEYVRVTLFDRDLKAGWVRLDLLDVGTTAWRIEVDLSERRVSAYRGGKRMKSYRAVVGTGQTPTPIGNFAVLEHAKPSDPSLFTGPWALHLTATSRVLKDFGGGPGRVAIHGRSGSSLDDPLGSAASHGCVRIDNDPVRWIAKHVPDGAPVHIRR